jgi:hypothetical protein
MCGRMGALANKLNLHYDHHPGASGRIRASARLFPQDSCGIKFSDVHPPLHLCGFSHWGPKKVFVCNRNSEASQFGGVWRRPRYSYISTTGCTAGPFTTYLQSVAENCLFCCCAVHSGRACRLPALDGRRARKFSCPAAVATRTWSWGVGQASLTTRRRQIVGI